jgi:hypothetical protein
MIPSDLLALFMIYSIWLLKFNIRQLGKINSYKNTIPIKRKLEVWKEIEEPERHISPLGKMYQQAEDMKTTENINANCIEPQYEYQGLVSTIHPPDHWRNLGNSKYCLQT